MSRMFLGRVLALALVPRTTRSAWVVGIAPHAAAVRRSTPSSASSIGSAASSGFFPGTPGSGRKESPRTAFRPSSSPSALFSSYVGPTQRSIESQLLSTFSPSHLSIHNESHGRIEDESHFKVVVVSEDFEDKNLVRRHRMVNEALSDDDGKLPFHSLTITAKTPEEWSVNDAVPESPKCAGGSGK